VRTQPRREREVLNILLETVASIRKTEGINVARIFSHQSAPGGLSLILFWDTPSVPKQGSETAQFILEGLKSLGLLDHTVLIEKGKEQKYRARSRGPEKSGGIQ